MFLHRCVVAALAVVIAIAPNAMAQPSAPPLAAATASHRAAVARLLEVTHARETLEQQADSMLDTQVKTFPTLAPLAQTLRTFYREMMNWSVMEPEMTQVYLETFTEAEIGQLITLYQTPAGRMLLAKTPALQQKLVSIQGKRMQAAMPKLMEMMQSAMPPE
jgi:uncharacterized protein